MAILNGDVFREVVDDVVHVESVDGDSKVDTAVGISALAVFAGLCFKMCFNDV